MKSLKTDQIAILAMKDIEAANHEEAIAPLIKLLSEKGYVKETYLNNVLQREKVYPTGLLLEGGINVALPHGDTEHVKKLSLAVGTLSKPVVFHHMGSDPKKEDIVQARIVFLLAVDDPKKLVPYLSRITKEIFLKQEVVRAIENARSESEIVKTVKSAVLETSTQPNKI